MQQRNAIASVVFGRGGIVGVKIRRVDLIGLNEDIRWLIKILDIDCGNFMHLLEFVDMSRKFWRVIQARGQVFAHLNII